MTTWTRAAFLAWIITLLLAANAAAEGWVHWSSGYYAPSYYNGPVYYCVPATPYRVVPLAPTVSDTGARKSPFAQPRSAPAFKTDEPPLDKRDVFKIAPKVTETRSSKFGGQREKIRDAGESSPARYRVGFWNVSGRDISLTVEGTARVLPRNRSITLLVPRDFTWSVDEQAAQSDQVPAGEATHEVIIRSDAPSR